MIQKTVLAALGITLAWPAAAQDCPEGERWFDHPILVSEARCIPAAPESVAFLHTNIITAHLLGQPPLVGNYYFRAFLDTYPGAMDRAAFDELIYFTNLRQADLESVISVDAELFSSITWTPEQNRLLTEAVTLLVPDADENRTDWRDMHDFTASILGRDAEGDALLEGFDTRMAQLQQAIAAETGDEPIRFAIVRTMDAPGTLQVFTDLAFGAGLAQSAGLQMADSILSPEDAATLQNSNWYPLPMERVQDLDTDRLIVMEGWDPAVEAEVMAGPLWQSLSVVRDGRVIEAAATGEHYIRPNVAFAHLVIDDLYRGVLGMEPDEAGSPNPYADWLSADQ